MASNGWLLQKLPASGQRRDGDFDGASNWTPAHGGRRCGNGFNRHQVLTAAKEGQRGERTPQRATFAAPLARAAAANGDALRPPPQDQCANCGKGAMHNRKLLRCTACKQARYVRSYLLFFFFFFFFFFC